MYGDESDKYQVNSAWFDVVTSGDNAGSIELSNDWNAGEWFMFIPASKYKDLINAQNKQTYIDVTGVLGNPRFIRNYKTEEWLWTGGTKRSEADNAVEEDQPYSISIHPWYGTSHETDYYSSQEGISSINQKGNFVQNHGAFAGAQINHATGSLQQIVSGLKPGLYALTAQAFYWPENTEGTSNAYLFANDAKTQIPALQDDELGD